MKTNSCRIAILFLAFFSFAKVNAQPNVGIGTILPDPSSVLDISATDKGLLIPRLTTAAKNAINVPATGLLIYQKDSIPGFYYYLNQWQALPLSAANLTLSNLAETTVVNSHLLPAGSASRDIGSSTNAWKDIYYGGNIYLTISGS